MDFFKVVVVDVSINVENCLNSWQGHIFDSRYQNKETLSEVI